MAEIVIENVKSNVPNLNIFASSGKSIEIVGIIANAHYHDELELLLVYQGPLMMELTGMGVKSRRTVPQMKKYPLEKIKAAFEIRAASILGFMPDVLSCRSCNEQSGDFFFDIMVVSGNAANIDLFFPLKENFLLPETIG